MVAEHIESGCDLNSDICLSYDISASYDYNSTYDYYEDNSTYDYYEDNKEYYYYYEDNEEYYYYDETEYCHDKRSVLRMAVSWNRTNFIRALIEVILLKTKLSTLHFIINNVVCILTGPKC